MSVPVSDIQVFGSIRRTDDRLVLLIEEAPLRADMGIDSSVYDQILFSRVLGRIESVDDLEAGAIVELV